MSPGALICPHLGDGGQLIVPLHLVHVSRARLASSDALQGWTELPVLCVSIYLHQGNCFHNLVRLTPHQTLLSLGHPPPELVVLGHDEVPLALVYGDPPGAHLAADGLVGVAVLAHGVVGSQGAVGGGVLGAD